MKKIAQKLGERTFLLAIIPGAFIVWIIFKLLGTNSCITLAVQLPFLFIQIIGIILYITYSKNNPI